VQREGGDDQQNRERQQSDSVEAQVEHRTQRS
jgi:hypothetical protein